MSLVYILTFFILWESIFIYWYKYYSEDVPWFGIKFLALFPSAFIMLIGCGIIDIANLKPIYLPITIVGIFLFIGLNKFIAHLIDKSNK